MNATTVGRIAAILIFPLSLGVMVQVGVRSGACSDNAAAASLSGRIVNPRGDSVSNSTGVSRAPARLYARSEAGEWVDSGPRKGTGGFSITGLEPGVYNLLIPASYFAGARYRPLRVWGAELKSGPNELSFAVQPGTTLERMGTPRCRDLETSRTGWIEGTVVSTGGVPAWGAKEGLEGVRLRLKGSRMVIYPAETRLDAGGFYEAHGLIPGKYDVTVPTTYHGNQVFKSKTLPGISIEAGYVTVLDIEVSERAERKRPVPQSIPILTAR